MSTFDFNEPLPDLRIRQARSSWEPAARHYQDLTEAEKSAAGTVAEASA